MPDDEYSCIYCSRDSATILCCVPVLWTGFSFADLRAFSIWLNKFDQETDEPLRHEFIKLMLLVSLDNIRSGDKLFKQSTTSKPPDKVSYWCISILRIATVFNLAINTKFILSCAQRRWSSAERSRTSIKWRRATRRTRVGQHCRSSSGGIKSSAGVKSSRKTRTTRRIS